MYFKADGKAATETGVLITLQFNNFIPWCVKTYISLPPRIIVYSEFLSYRGRRLGVHDDIKIVAFKIEQGPVTTRCVLRIVIKNGNAHDKSKIIELV